jgi:predicted nucleic acid-binding protein
VVDAGRQPRRRFADLLIAAVAVSEGLPLVTRNAMDFAGLTDLVTLVEI